MRQTEFGLLCPRCEYDLRGLEDGRCPECGNPFRAEELEPEQPGLAIENWINTAGTFGSKVFLPVIAALSPRKAFQRRCRLDDILTVSPIIFLLVTVGWYVLLTMVSVVADYSLDKYLGYQRILSYWVGLNSRFGCVTLLPVRLPIAWLQGLLVSLVGMAVASRTLSVNKVVRLATWLLAFSLLGGLCAIMVGNIWDRLLGPMLDGYPPVRIIIGDLVDVQMRDLIAILSNDIVIGLAGGYAVGTIFRKRQWTTAILSAVLLAALYPAYHGVGVAYLETVNYLIYERGMDSYPCRPTRMPLSLGPTFAVGTTVPDLRGTWEIQYDDEQQTTMELVFDDAGQLCRLNAVEDISGDIIVLVADGSDHEMYVPKDNNGEVTITYRILSGCQRVDEHILINIRVERMYTRWVTQRFFEQIPDISEETFTGVIDDNESCISGTSVYVREVPGMHFAPEKLERSFVMKRTSSTTSGPTP